VGRALLQDPHWLLKVRDGRAEELMAFERTAFAALS
jgi:2,4-dienoyl-CoA reductase-like NADH-dependent reductase (Old Yellow Enzyme family)